MQSYRGLSVAVKGAPASAGSTRQPVAPSNIWNCYAHDTFLLMSSSPMDNTENQGGTVLRRRIGITALAAAALAAIVARRSPPTAGAGSRAAKDVRLSLVAYSTPREAYGKLIPAFQKTPEGDGVTFTQSYGASGDQARAVKAGLKADIVALSLAPDVDELVQGRARRRQVEPAVVQGHRPRLGRRVRRPRRQPEEDQDLGRPAQAGRLGDHAEPVHLRRRTLERDGRVRLVAQAQEDEESRPRRSCSSCSRT